MKHLAGRLAEELGSLAKLEEQAARLEAELAQALTQNANLENALREAIKDRDQARADHTRISSADVAELAKRHATWHFEHRLNDPGPTVRVSRPNRGDKRFRTTEEALRDLREGGR